MKLKRFAFAILSLSFTTYAYAEVQKNQSNPAEQQASPHPLIAQATTNKEVTGTSAGGEKQTTVIDSSGNLKIIDKSKDQTVVVPSKEPQSVQAMPPAPPPGTPAEPEKIRTTTPGMLQANPTGVGQPLPQQLAPGQLPGGNSVAATPSGGTQPSMPLQPVIQQGEQPIQSTLPTTGGNQPAATPPQPFVAPGQAAGPAQMPTTGVNQPVMPMQPTVNPQPTSTTTPVPISQPPVNTTPLPSAPNALPSNPDQPSGIPPTTISQPAGSATQPIGGASPTPSGAPSQLPNTSNTIPVITP